MPDIKKLITGFLIIATAASSAALILSTTASQTATANQLALNATGTVTLNGQDAFVPTETDVIDAATESDPQIAAAVQDPKNLTTNFTNAFLNSVATANPDGFATDDSGNVSLQEPDASAFAAQVANSPVFKEITIPNWDAQVNAQKINVSATATAQAYNDAINHVFSKDFIQSGVASLMGQTNLDPSNVAAIAPPMQNAVGDAAQTPVPSNLANFQKSLIAMLVYEQNMIQLGTLAQTDPVKASLAYEAEEQHYLTTMSNFQNQFQSASAAGLVSLNIPPTVKQNRAIALLNTFLGIQTADAQWPTFDIANFGEWILSMVNNIILQILKNTLIAFMQQRILVWIKGSGAPKFVQQWGATLANAYTQKAISSLSQVLAATCPNIGPLIKPIQVNLINSIGGNNKVLSCPLPSGVSLSQLSNFYNNFNVNLNTVQGGSWGLYAQILNPNGGNYFATLLGANDYANTQGNQAQVAMQTQVTSNQGFKAQGTCTDGSNPNGTSSLCDDLTQPTNKYTCPGGNVPIPTNGCLTPGTQPTNGVCSGPGNGVTTYYDCGGGIKANFGSVCGDGSQPSSWDNNGECTDGSEPKTTTPGQVTKTLIGSGSNAAIQLTVNANSIVGVLASVATSLLNTLVSAGVSAAESAGVQGLTSITLSATAGGPSQNGGTTVASAGTNAPSQPTGGPSLPPTQCSPHNPVCSQGSGSQCDSGYFGDELTFSATGADGLSYSWAVGSGGNVTTQIMGPTTNTPTFSVVFVPGDNFNTSTLPLTIPITVTGSDGVSDTCLAVIGQ